MTMLFLLNSMVVLSDSVLFHVEHLLLQPPSQEPPIRVQVRGQMTWVELSNDKSTTQPQRSKGQTFQATILQEIKQSERYLARVQILSEDQSRGAIPQVVKRNL